MKIDKEAAIELARATPGKAVVYEITGDKWFCVMVRVNRNG